MPASSGVGIVGSHIESSLRASLSGGHSNTSTLDQKLISSAKRVLLHKIDFEQAENDSRFQLNSLRTKYKPLNPSKPEVISNKVTNIQMVPTPTIHKSNNEFSMANGHVVKTKMAYSMIPNDGIPKPAVVLFSPEKVLLEWKTARGAGVGLRNNNNNCYLNSVLQCLTYSPPLVNYLYSNDHTYTCKQAGFCMMCELQRHIKRCLEQPRIPNRDCTISPQSILGKIKMIAKHLSYGRQEDAHEFLRYVVEAMQKSCLHGYPEKLDRFSKDTTVVNQIFGGYLRSQVMCLKCKERSNTYDPLLDISLDIKNVNTLQRAFERFVQPETLDNENAYNCPRCKAKVPAQKRFTVHRAPNILTVQLKRFDYNRMTGGKVTRQILYPERLDLRSYMSITKGPPVTYQLYAVLTHVGHSAGSGHYFCNIRAPNKQWFTMNDQHVSEIGLQRVLNTEAYLLFYCRIKPKVNQYDIQKPMIGPKLPAGHKLQVQEKRLPLLSEPSGDAGSPVPRRENGKLQKSSNNVPVRLGGDGDGTSLSAPKPTPIPAEAQREKVSFELAKPRPVELAKPKPVEKNPPRIVMHIRNGKVFFPSDGKDDNVRRMNGLDGKTKLVPYNDDSSEEEGLVIRPPVPSQPNKDKSKSNGKSNGIVFDERLNATTVVPGSYKPLDTGCHLDGLGKTHGDCSPMKAMHTPGRFASPPCRPVGDSLSVITNTGSQHRVSATTPWHVLDPDSAISPSLASGSSNTSMNSTTEWQVTAGADGKRAKPMLPEVVPQCNGWTITPVKDTNGQQSSGDKGPAGTKQGTAVENGAGKVYNELNITIKKQPHNGGWESRPKHSDLFMAEFPDVEINNDERSASASSTSSTSGAARGSPKRSESAPSLPNGHAGTNGFQADAHKRHKKHKKRQRDRSDEDDEDQVNGCGASDLLGMLKKKKKKKHKHGDRERLLSTSDSDSSRRDSKRSSSSDDTDDSRHKQRPASGGGERKVAGALPSVWVEKNLETMNSERAAVKKEVPVQSWDHYVNDGYKRRTHEEQGKTKASWDGVRSKSDTVLSEMKMMSNRGYGNQVSSWEGAKSSVDKEVERERQHCRKRQWSDDYEDELDRGKIKKLKPYSNSNFSKSHAHSYGNPFQKLADIRREDSDWDRERQRPNKYDRPHYAHSAYGGGYNRHNYHSAPHFNYSRDGGYGNQRRDRYHR